MGVRSSTGDVGKFDIPDGIKTQEGVEAFFRILGSNEKQVIVAKQTDRLRPSEKRTQAEVPGHAETQDPDRSADESPDERSYAEPTSPLEKSLCSMWAAALNLPRIGIDDSFFERGGHSLLALQLVSQIRKNSSIKVSARDIFLFPTVRQLAAELETRESQTGLSA